jgi:hypothetical protein
MRNIRQVNDTYWLVRLRVGGRQHQIYWGNHLQEAKQRHDEMMFLLNREGLIAEPFYHDPRFPELAQARNLPPSPEVSALLAKIKACAPKPVARPESRDRKLIVQALDSYLAAPTDAEFSKFSGILRAVAPPQGSPRTQSKLPGMV